MANLSSNLRTKLQNNLDTDVNLIVRLADNPNQRIASIQSRGFTVRRTLSLISAVALCGSGSAALDLAKEPWVISIEEDKPVHTM
jgi:hypothetical protein